ncbi:MAG: DUF3710 domain-containing protein [Candidatus Nanopelagicales bacterium]
MFKRRRGGSADHGDEPAATTGETVADESAAQQDTSEAAPSAAKGTLDSGPFDIADKPDDDIARVDLGGLQIPIVDNMQLHLEGHNEETDTFALAVVVLDEQAAALQLMAVAAPRSGGFWLEVMDELESEITQAGGTITRSEGRFGPELAGQVPAQDPEGNPSLQAARFVGAEGNRWFIRGMFMGTAATNPAMGEFFEDILAGCIVNRGERPMAPGDLVGLNPPEGVEVEEEEGDEGEELYEDMEPFERGPEITETR